LAPAGAAPVAHYSITGAETHEDAVKWPLYHQEKVAAPDGSNAADFGTITREDGKRQTTYKGSPLYYFEGDKAPGDVMGQGMGNVWFAANP